MAQTKHYYIVTGNDPFPDDILRYDQAKIVGTGIMPVLNKTAYLIHGYCTIPRWLSFTWVVWAARQHFPAGDSEKGPIEWKVEVGPGNWERIDIRSVPISAL